MVKLGCEATAKALLKRRWGGGGKASDAEIFHGGHVDLAFFLRLGWVFKMIFGQLKHFGVSWSLDLGEEGAERVMV